MTNEERDIITQFIERLSGHAQPVAGSVPSASPALPAVDPEADALIGGLFAKYPEARYRLTQTAFVQEHALIEAQGRMQRMQSEIEQAHQAQPAGQGASARPGGFLSGLFGGSVSQGQPVQPSQPGQPQGQPQPSPVWNQGQAAQPAYAQQYAPPPPQFAPSAMQQGGSGFLGSALRTAAGVAGGVVAGNLLMDAFSGHGGGMFGGGGGMMPGGIGGNFGGGMGGESPWATPGADAAVDQGGWNTDAPADPGVANDAGNDPGWSDQQASNDGGGWSDSGGSGGDSSGGDFGGGDSGGGDSGGGDWS